MPSYRLFCLNGSERTTKVDEFRAKDDDEAITVALDGQGIRPPALEAKLPALERTENSI